jgi:hypothetical protein
MEMSERSSQQAMKVTTLRFGRDLWQLLEREAGRVGTSVSQYVREAALARAAAAAGARGESPFDLLAAEAGELVEWAETDDQRSRIEEAIDVIAHARDTRDSALALRAQSRQAREQSLRRKARAAGAVEDAGRRTP